MNLDVQIRGLNKTIKALRDKSEDIQKESDVEINRTAKIIESKAKQSTPIDTGRLRSSIVAERIKELDYEIVANSHYAPYIEFGTVTRVDVPAGLEGYAMQFKGNGIITTGGLPARPFLFPAFESERPELMKRLKKILNGR